ncbi:unnamed protein product [Arabidopsis lyrata]|uniref:Predicted protein n=1 Tax=Arabidopsis lyrata subsp. lyrata TaxID=81972 RepID=D7KU95_ARALL|nr:predicted protein [Arabidopsis lyrata subsp. lyrata]EFH64782.1 predicted protein [Arabidopsis lyrata subsp. lyrata]CAH8262796.1 unnamed protein product [Arabidopsis lyrata]
MTEAVATDAAGARNIPSPTPNPTRTEPMKTDQRISTQTENLKLYPQNGRKHPSSNKP